MRRYGGALSLVRDRVDHRRLGPVGDAGLVGDSTNIAVALNYDGSGAPRITAKGEHHMAEQILALAEEHQVPLYPNAELAATLVQITLGEEVPEQLYRAVTIRRGIPYHK